MKSFKELQTEISETRDKIKDTNENVRHNASVERDVMRLVGPMLLDVLAITEEVLEYAKYSEFPNVKED